MEAVAQGSFPGVGSMGQSLRIVQQGSNVQSVFCPVFHCVFYTSPEKPGDTKSTINRDMTEILI